MTAHLSNAKDIFISSEKIPTAWTSETWLMGFMSFVSLYQALIFRNTWVGVNVTSINSKGDKESPWMIPRINFMFLGNCPPTPLLSQHFALSEQ